MRDKSFLSELTWLDKATREEVKERIYPGGEIPTEEQRKVGKRDRRAHGSDASKYACDPRRQRGKSIDTDIPGWFKPLHYVLALRTRDSNDVAGKKLKEAFCHGYVSIARKVRGKDGSSKSIPSKIKFNVRKKATMTSLGSGPSTPSLSSSVSKEPGGSTTTSLVWSGGWMLTGWGG